MILLAPHLRRFSFKAHAKLLGLTFFSATTLWLLSPLIVLAETLLDTRIPIVYQGPDSVAGKDKRNDYYVELLRQVLIRAGDHYRLVEGPRGFSSTRQFQLLKAGAQDVNWNFSDPKWNSYFHQIDFPIDRGLIGWRLAMVRSDHMDLFKKVRTLEDLKNFSLAQGQAWQDTPIFKANGLPVIGAPNYEGIFHMLLAGHIDYFPRSILEIQEEINTHQNLPLSIDSHLLIYYPNAFYFFVDQNNLPLAGEIERGLQLMYNSGDFDAFFMKYKGDDIAAAHVENRHIIYLQNPFFSEANLAHLRRYGLKLPGTTEIKLKPN